MSQHTPGPWSVRKAVVPTDGEYDHGILDSEGAVIAEAFGLVGVNVTRPSGANAALIASAPEMADALEAVMAWANGGIRGWSQIEDKIEAALRKAGRLP